MTEHDWKEEYQDLCEVANALENERDRYKRQSEALYEALKMALEIAGVCACESGGGINDLEPGFICGFHSLLNEFEND